MKRKLGVHEHVMWLIEQTAPYNIQAALTVVGKFTESIVDEALHLLQQQHPYLRSRIKTGSVLSYVDTEVPIDCKIIEYISDKQYFKKAKQELKKTTVAEDKPMVRVVWLKGKRTHRFIFTINHMIIDGIGISLLVKQFLKICAVLREGKRPKIKKYSDRFNIEKVLQWQDSRIVLPKFQFKQAKHYTAHISHKFSKDITSKLIALARKNKTSVQGALCAAFMLAERQLSKTSQIASFSPINMRPYLDISLDPHELSNYITAVMVSSNIDKNTSFWELARYVKTELNRIINVNGHIDTLANWRKNIKKYNTPKKINDLFKSLHKNPIIPVSNLGVLDVPEKIGNYAVKDLSIVANLPTLWPKYLAVVYSLHGQLVINFCYSYPNVTKAKAVKYKELVLRILMEQLL